MLLMAAGEHCYAVPCRRVREVISRLRLQPLPEAPHGVVGTFNYRGTMTPVVDLCQVVEGRPCSARMSSRIVIFDGLLPSGQRTLGLLAERVTQATHIELAGKTQAGIAAGTSVVIHDNAMIALLDLDALVATVFPALSATSKAPASYAPAEHRR